MAQGLQTLSSALALRLRDIARMLDRLDRLESGTGEWLTSLDDEALRDAATEMSLRALRLAADPTNFSILKFLSAHTSAPMAELEKTSGLGRLALTERVNDLVQVGLAGRNIDTDHVQSAEAGNALAGLIESIATETAKQIQIPKSKRQTVEVVCSS